ncbi:unnamed protein product [Onchocerca ochengi]|uniref:BTB domain-containing protein n=1 Tax=Onchocerca ochengi TaxID=42157 RepID=A0A182E760_ONCOC|nr:unnamed protein product [Onchocerca ochengi]
MSNDTFSQQTLLRQFELIVEKKSIFINAHYLAELSPYFKVLCFENTFREAQNGRAEIKDEKYDDVIELFRFICPNDDCIINRNITESNFALLTHFSNLLQLRDLRHQLENYVVNEVRMENYKPKIENLLEMIIEAVNASFPQDLMDILYRKLARHDLDYIEAFRVYPMQLPYRSSYNYDQSQQGIF